MTFRLKSLSSTSVLAMYWWVQPSTVSAHRTSSRNRGRKGVTVLFDGRGETPRGGNVFRGDIAKPSPLPQARLRRLVSPSRPARAERLLQQGPGRRQRGYSVAPLPQLRAKGVRFERHAHLPGIEQRSDRA